MTRALAIHKPWRQLAIESMVAVSLCVSFFFLMLPCVIGPRFYDHNSTNSFLFTRLSNYPLVFNAGENYQSEFPIFFTRNGSQLLSGWVYDRFDLIKTPAWNGYAFPSYAVAFGVYQAVWLALLFLLLIFYRADALLIMLGVFAGLMYNLNIPAGSWWCPWDMPILCLFTWALLAFNRSDYWLLVAVTFAAGLFKETGACTSLLVLLGPWSWTKRVGGFAALVIAFAVTHKFFMYWAPAATIFLPVNEAVNTQGCIPLAMSQLKGNLHSIFSLHLNHPLFINCGLLFAMFLMPCRWPVRVTAAAFMAGQLLFGTVWEFRDFFEILPLGLMLTSDYLKAKK